MKVCECGMEFVEKKDYYRHKNKCKPKPLPQPRQLNLFGGR